jgi:acyl-CoA thioester hydrolase
MGVPYTRIEEEGLRFPVTRALCQYHRPAYYDDEILIETALASVGRASLVFRYKIYRAGVKELLAEGETTHACIDKEGRITRIPPPLSSALDRG